MRRTFSSNSFENRAGTPPRPKEALSAAPAIGVLLPCTVVAAADDAGGSVVSAIDPVAMFEVTGRPDIDPPAKEVGGRLDRVLDALGGER